jgi:type IV secretion system protein TrbJ
MPMHCLAWRKAARVVVLVIGVTPSPSSAFVATEFTQILNNLELVGISAKSVEQVSNQLTQIDQLAQQIRNQIQIYENMRQNTLKLPDYEWGQLERDFAQLQQMVRQGQGIAFSMAGLDQVLQQRFPSFAQIAAQRPPDEDLTATYQSWSDTNRGTIAATLRAAGLTSEQFDGEAATLTRLRAMSESSVGQMQALQIAHQLASQQIEQTQKLRGLVSQQMAMVGTWYQSEQAARDVAQARREAFFAPIEIGARNYQQMEPRW